MGRGKNKHGAVTAWAAMALMAWTIAAPAYGAGFSIFEQGTKSMGMAGAFTAQADDPSAIFHNPAGIAFQEETDFLVGFTYIRSLEGSFEGANPFPGVGTMEEQETLSEFPPHLYWVQPMGDTVTFGLGINAPFGLTTEWKNPDTFTGRFISTRASLTAVDINPNLAFKVNENFALSVGATARVSGVELTQHVPFPNPFTQTISDIATADLESDVDNTGYGFNVGLLHRATDNFSWGLSYRSKVEIDYEGTAVFSQNLTGTPLDQLVPTQLPLNQDIDLATTIEFPDQASLGLALRTSDRFLVEADFNWTGWSTFDVLPLDFSVDSLDTERVQNWDDAFNFRLGFRVGDEDGNQWRFGYVFDETPQPEEAVSPLLPDADRNGFSIGYGWVGNKYTFDFALLYLLFDDPERFTSFPGEGDYFGTYENEAVLLGLSLGF